MQELPICQHHKEEHQTSKQMSVSTEKVTVCVEILDCSSNLSACHPGPTEMIFEIERCWKSQTQCKIVIISSNITKPFHSHSRSASLIYVQQGNG